MGLGLHLRAQAESDQPLSEIERVLDERFQDVVERVSIDDEAARFRLHPAAEDVEIIRAGDVIEVTAKTSTVGPGYHAFLCLVLRRLGEELEWTWERPEEGSAYGDETGFFFSGDRAALETEMLSWLQGVCASVEGLLAEGVTDLALSMSTDAIYEAEGALVTPLGPREPAWLAAVRQDARAGIDFFAWWNPSLDAAHALGRALTRMWTDVRWREPITEDEEDVQDRVDDDLRRAFLLDKALPLPWAEWAEISAFSGHADAFAIEIAKRGAHLRGTIGYRRRPVRVTLSGGWTINIPGEMGASFDDDGTWNAFSPGRTIWMTSFTMGDPETPTRTATETLSPRPLAGETLPLNALPNDLAARASVESKDDGTTNVNVEIAKPHNLAVLTMVVDDAADVAWAKAVAESVR